MNKPRRHADLIKAWADGAEIEYRDLSFSDHWFCINNPDWSDNREYRIKPEKEYPKSSLTNGELHIIAFAAENSLASWRAIADEAVKCYIKENEE